MAGYRIPGPAGSSASPVLHSGTLPKSAPSVPGPIRTTSKVPKGFQFKPYPIYVVYSKYNQLEREYDAAAFRRAGDYEGEKLARNVGITTPDTPYPVTVAEAQRYEDNIRLLLRRIQTTAIGKIFFPILKNDVWVVPKTSDHTNGGCYCAITLPLDYDTKNLNYVAGRGDSFIWFNPDSAFQDDTLFHEFIHAYRFGAGTFKQRMMANNEYNTEEFLAHVMQNIYRSLKGLPLLFTYSTGTVKHHPSEHGRTGSIYQHFLTNAEFIMVLKHFLDNDDLTKLVAKMKQPEFNPFRDYKILERMYLDQVGDPSIKTLPEF
jgi:hypothetical protein